MMLLKRELAEQRHRRHDKKRVLSVEAYSESWLLMSRRICAEGPLRLSRRRSLCGLMPCVGGKQFTLQRANDKQVRVEVLPF